jgi:glutathione S-transferase
MITLYQFPISHFCEKVRWTLAYKKLEHTLVDLLPGFHAKPMMKLSGHHSVPVLTDTTKAIANSSDILNYLDRHYPEPSLMPTDPSLKQEVLEWERFADKEIGPQVRKICYHTLLDHPKRVREIFCLGQPWYKALLIKLIFPKLAKKMRVLMQINEESVAESKIRLDAALQRLSLHLKDKKYLAGNQFSRADLSVASLLAPFVRPSNYGFERYGKTGYDWSAPYPAALQNYIDQHSEILAWVSALYQKHR